LDIAFKIEAMTTAQRGFVVIMRAFKEWTPDQDQPANLLSMKNFTVQPDRIKN
jgi:hypothetical protein